ncbi:hypothetical protein ACFL5O_03525 [Myxococcota bacterium]
MTLFGAAAQLLERPQTMTQEDSKSDSLAPSILPLQSEGVDLNWDEDVASASGHFPIPEVEHSATASPDDMAEALYSAEVSPQTTTDALRPSAETWHPASASMKGTGAAEAPGAAAETLRPVAENSDGMVDTPGAAAESPCAMDESPHTTVETRRPVGENLEGTVATSGAVAETWRPDAESRRPIATIAPPRPESGLLGEANETPSATSEYHPPPAAKPFRWIPPPPPPCAGSAATPRPGLPDEVSDVPGPTVPYHSSPAEKTVPRAALPPPHPEALESPALLSGSDSQPVSHVPREHPSRHLPEVSSRHPAIPSPPPETTRSDRAASLRSQPLTLDFDELGRDDPERDLEAQIPTSVPESPPSSTSLVLNPPEVEHTHPLREELRDRYAMGDFSGALNVAEELMTQIPNDSDAQRYALSCREVLAQMLMTRLGRLDQIVQTRMAPEQIRWLSLDHRAGFLLSLVDNFSTAEELLDISGMPRLEALHILVSLLDQQVIVLEPPPKHQ